MCVGRGAGGWLPSSHEVVWAATAAGTGISAAAPLAAMGQTVSEIQTSASDAAASLAKELGLESNAGSYASVLEGVGPDRSEQLLARLQVMANKKLRFKHVAVWRQAFFGGVVDHHTIVYEYQPDSCLKSLKVDWGRDGMSFIDSREDPCPNGDVIRRKLCRLDPMDVHTQIVSVKDRQYDLVRWNCQHFSAFMFDQAGEAFSKSPGLPRGPSSATSEQGDADGGAGQAQALSKSPVVPRGPPPEPGGDGSTGEAQAPPLAVEGASPGADLAGADETPGAAAS